MKNLTEPHKQVDARIASAKPVLMESAIAGHVLTKNKGRALPFRENPVMLSVFGYDATAPKSKNTDVLFQLGYTSSPEMGQAVLGTERHFDQAARGGTIVVGGRAAANGPSYISDVSYESAQIHWFMYTDLYSPWPQSNRGRPWMAPGSTGT